MRSGKVKGKEIETAAGKEREGIRRGTVGKRDEERGRGRRGRKDGEGEGWGERGVE